MLWRGDLARAFLFPFFLFCEKEPSSRGLTHLVAAALPKSSICALKLRDRTSLTGAMRAPFLQFRRARGTSAAPPSEGSGGGVLGSGVFFFNPKKTEKKRKVDFTRSEIKKRYFGNSRILFRNK